MISVFVFTPVYRLEPATVEALFKLEHDGPLTWHLQRDNPHDDGRENITHQYQRGRVSFLDGGYDVWLSIESDIIPPPDTIERLLALDADIAYGHYFFRVSPVSNIFCRYYEHKPQRNPGESISVRPGAYASAMQQGVIDCTGGGLGVTMIKRHVLQQIDFRHDSTQGGHCDSYFTIDAMAHRYTMRADTGLLCGHVREDGSVVCVFLEILTRCHNRPLMQAINRESLEQQTCDDWSQTLFIDDDGVGMAAAQEQFAGYTPDGEYVWILDDDDMAAHDTLVEELMTIAFAHDPDVIMLRMDHGQRGILPDNGSWGDRPQKARIGCSGFVVSNQMWRLFRWAWKPGSYNSDWNFINAVWECQPNVYWHDVVGSRVQRISLGATE